MKFAIFQQYRHKLLNGVYFLLVFLASFAIATQAMARQGNAYNRLLDPVRFSVEKEKVLVSNSVAGKVEAIHVTNGQYVRAGDVLMELKDDTVTQKLSVLESVESNNLSARTEAEVLRAQTDQYTIQAPRDGVVYQIHVGVGSYLITNTPMVTIFASENVKLLTEVDEEQYALMLQQKNFDVYSVRLEQVYSTSFESVRKINSPTDMHVQSYEVQFRFLNSDEGAGFIQGEQLEIVDFTEKDSGKRPGDYVVDFWNMLIIGEVPDKVVQ